MATPPPPKKKKNGRIAGADSHIPTKQKKKTAQDGEVGDHNGDSVGGVSGFRAHQGFPVTLDVC